MTFNNSSGGWVDPNFTHVYSKDRGGRVPFRRSKLEDSIENAAIEVGGFFKQIVPEEIFGYEIMEPFRYFPFDDNGPGKRLIANMVISSLNGLNPSQTTFVSSGGELPNPNFTPSVEKMHDFTIDKLFETGFNTIAEAYLLHRSVHALSRGSKAEFPQELRPYQGFPSEKKRQEFIDLYREHGVDTVDKINAFLHDEGGQGFKDMITQFEELYVQQVQQAFEAFKLKHAEKPIKAIVIAGKSSSGKTTTMHRICDELIEKELGLNLVPLSVDNYFSDFRPKDDKGRIFYEDPEALDMDLLGKHLELLAQGKEVETPIFDKDLGRRIEKTIKKKVGPKDILVIDSHVGMYPKIMEPLRNEEANQIPINPFVIYLQPFNMIMEGDGSSGEYFDVSYTNMLRRWLRDRLKTGKTTYEYNIPHWELVRRAELRDIVPRMNLADAIINTGFPFEYNFLKTKFMQHGDAVWDQLQLPDTEYFLSGKGKNTTGAVYAYHAHRLLDQFEPVPESWYTLHDGIVNFKPEILPEKSILREFLGGSFYDK
ncbi:MAG: hypothetical protein KKF44_02920 [Nanoarchaeota archaeon]|nr:hypothetical protein [Nanoarchaeota archaeon]